MRTLVRCQIAWHAFLTAVLSLCSIYHFCNGLWTFLITWGITVSPRSQIHCIGARFYGCVQTTLDAFRLRHNPAKLGSAFGWSIAAAIVSFLVGGMISMVLFIVSAVFVSRVRRAYAAAPMGAYGYQQPQQYQQGFQVPQQPVNQQVPPQPQQPMQGQAPAAP